MMGGCFTLYYTLRGRLSYVLYLCVFVSLCEAISYLITCFKPPFPRGWCRGADN